MVLLCGLVSLPLHAQKQVKDERLNAITEAYNVKKKRLLDPLNAQHLKALERHKLDVMKRVI